MKFRVIISLLVFCFSQMPEKIYGQTSQHLSVSEQQDSTNADAFVKKAQEARDKGSFESAFQFLESARILRNQLADSSGIANIYAVKSTIYQKQRNQTKAIASLLDAIKIHESIGDRKNAALDYNLMGEIYEKQKDHLNAEANFIKALSIFESLDGAKNKEYAASLMINLSAFYLKQDLPEKALEYGEKSAEINKLAKNKVGLARSNFIIGNIYLQLEKYELAENYYLESLDYLKDYNYPSLKASIYHQMSKVYLNQKKLNKSLDFVSKAHDFFESSGSINDLRDTYHTFSLVYESKKQHYKALEYHKKYLEFLESSFNEESKRIVQEFLSKYDSEKKEAEIVLLEKEQKIKEVAIKKQRFQIISFAFLGLLLALLATGLIYYNRRIQLAKDQIAVEKERSENLLLNILPEDVAAELKESGKYRAQSFSQISVLFADIAGFTKLAENLSPDELVRDIDEYFSAFDEIVGQYGTEKIKTIGDAYMVAGGLKGDPEEAAIQTVKMAIAFQIAMKKINSKRQQFKKALFEIRIGIHTGIVVAGIVGSRKFAYDIWGDTVNIASRMESSGEINTVNISQSTFELVKDHFKCIHRGKIYAKNKGAIEMYFVSPKEQS